MVHLTGNKRNFSNVSTFSRLCSSVRISLIGPVTTRPPPVFGLGALMDKSRSLELFAQGKDAWNKWANGMLAEKKRLKEAGKWEAEKDRWEDEAKADFSQHPLHKHATFAGFTFPGTASFNNSTFPGDALFKQATFLGNASFFNTTFSKEAQFELVRFYGEVKFNGVNFLGNTTFDRSHFHENALFFDVTFSGNTWFVQSRFYGLARFTSTFEKTAQFANAKFIANPQKLGAKAYVADFKAINSKRHFSLNGAHFEQVPDFTQAHFLEAPSLDKIVIGPEARENPTPPASQSPSPLRGGIKGGGKTAILRQAQDEGVQKAQDESRLQAPTELEKTAQAKEAKEVPTRWRHLRRLATQGHDHENEQYFFAEEIKSRRGVFDHRSGKNWQRWWAGHAYEWFSDFGRSIARPFLWWLIGIIAYSAILLGFHLSAASTRPPLGINGCLLGDSTPWTTALKTAFDNALLLPMFGISDGQIQEKLCLFGHDIGLKMSNLPPVPLLPLWVSFAGAFHTIFSATMIFLILLAIRNQFRIR